jgi:hypothetical protein
MDTSYAANHETIENVTQMSLKNLNTNPEPVPAKKLPEPTRISNAGGGS